MRFALAAVATLALAACGASSAAVAPSMATQVTSARPASARPATASSGLAPVASPTVMSFNGTFTQNATWKGTVNITGTTTINPGVTVTVRPGTTINVTADPALSIFVNGTLDMEGTGAARVVVRPTVASGHWHRFVVGVGGRLVAHYLDETGGGFRLAGGSVTLIDSTMSRAYLDLLEGSGTVDVEYSSIGLEPGGSDTTHCDMHFDPGRNTLKVVHTNVSTGVYGMMFYGGSGADFTYDNWFSNQVNVEVLPGYPVSGDFSHGWFDRSPPGGPGITANDLAGSRLPAGQAGPR